MQVRFSYDDHTLDALRRAVSQPRLQRYEHLANGDITLALRLYQWNTSLAEALYGPLLSLEVTLRNALHERLSLSFGDDWCFNPRTGLRPAQLKRIHEARHALIYEDKPIEASRVLANLSFGFWVGLFGPKYETGLWRSHMRWIFSHAPLPLLRRTVHERLDRVRRLRNRVAHYEPVLHLPLQDEHRAILELIAWLCPVAATWTARLSRLETVLQNRPQTLNSMSKPMQVRP